jgi:MOSC domain-containing protein YiiM
MPLSPKRSALQIESIQTGVARRLRVGERTVLSAHGKTPTEGAVAVLPLGLMGDEQADPSIHGGLQKAVYAYPLEHYAFWQTRRQAAGVSEIDASLPPGSLGENLTLSGLLETDVWAGDLLRFANCTLRVTLPREPCHKLNAALGFSGASKAMAQSGFCGFYLAVDEPGTLTAGEAFELIPGRRGASIVQLFAAKMTKHLR